MNTKKGNYYSSNVAGGSYRTHRLPHCAVRRAHQIGHFGEFGLVKYTPEDQAALDEAAEECDPYRDGN